MTDDLYERYKEALRVGHVAVLRGALDEALQAYRTAASIAPSRALPHTSLGGVLLRLGHLEEALVEYAAAVARAPHDEGALLGQAEALTTAGQRVDAAQALDHVSEIQEAAGRLPEAADTLRRALELEDAPERARHQRGLLREIRLSAGDQAAEQLLARALRLREEPTAAPIETARAGSPTTLIGRVNAGTAASANQVRIATGFDESVPAGSFEDGSSNTREELVESAAPETESFEIVAAAYRAEDLGWPAADLAQTRPEPVPEAVQPAATLVEEAVEEPAEAEAKVAELVAAAVAQPDADLSASIEPILAAVGVMAGKFDEEVLVRPVGESQHQPTGDELLVAAEAADLSGDSTTLRSLLLWTARAYAREGRFEAALDATHRLLQKAPGDVDAHLVLVELYVARDWNSLAAEKLALLGRIADLNDDEETKQRLCAVAARAFPKDERLGALCA
jgi:tetratricopeptide (TPR) repeat protein